MSTNDYAILYNPISGNNQGEAVAKALKEKLNAQSIKDMTKVESYTDFFAEHQGENIVICGGDGTLNRFLNDVSSLSLSNSIYFYPCGSGNDFCRDINAPADGITCIDEYIKALPVCTVNEKEYKFINGIGYGIDGYCCEVGDKLRLESTKPINYAGIAIKGLLFHYKPTDATVTVDGVKHEFKKVWIAPTMLGRYYGGGMMPTPNQNRLNDSQTLSVMIFHDTSSLQTLMIFPSIFKGEHIKKDKKVTVLEGKEITVEFSEPRTLQIDGETVLNVKKYGASFAKIPVEI